MKTKKTNHSSKAKPVRHVKTVLRVTPKFIHGIVVGGLVGLMLVIGLRATSSAAADANSATCLISPVVLANGLGELKSFTVNGDTATTSFTVNGLAGCSVTVTLASWQAPFGSTNFLPIASQKLLFSKTSSFTPGQYTMSIQINPDCFYQVDVVRGSSPTAADGTPNYTSPLIDFIQAGSTVCQPPPVPVTPASAATPTPTATTPTTPTTLVNTGPGAVIVVGVLAAIGGTIFHMTHRHVKHKRRAAHHSA